MKWMKQAPRESYYSPIIKPILDSEAAATALPFATSQAAAEATGSMLAYNTHDGSFRY